MESSPGALRIELDDSPPDRSRFRLEGRLGARELETLRRSIEPLLDSGREIEIDLSALRFLDERGARLLQTLRGRGARLMGSTGYVRELLRAVEEER